MCIINTMKNQTFIFIGRSGCGKDTQINLFEKKLKERDSEEKIQIIKSGDAFRKFWKEDKTYSGDLSRKIMEEGGLQPEFLTVYLWGKELIENITSDEVLILDGTPRRLNEAEVLDSALRFYKREKPTVVYMNVSREWSVTRLTERGRADDTIDQINERLDWFDEDVVPALDYLKNNDYYNFVEIQGEQPIEDVRKEILEKLEI